MGPHCLWGGGGGAHCLWDPYCLWGPKQKNQMMNLDSSGLAKGYSLTCYTQNNIHFDNNISVKPLKFKYILVTSVIYLIFLI